MVKELKEVSTQELISIVDENVDQFDFTIEPELDNVPRWLGRIIDRESGKIVASCQGNKADEVRESLADLVTRVVMDQEEVVYRGSARDLISNEPHIQRSSLL
jgi:hypothetical protein